MFRYSSKHWWPFFNVNIDDLEEYATRTDLDFEKVMNDDIVEWTTTAKTFVFGTGQLLTLRLKQINQLPYLVALISAADNYNSIINERGHYVLNQRIKFEHFCFIVSSLPFRSDQQLFTRLPKHHSAMAVLALYDFLGMAPKTVPTLDKINQTLFPRKDLYCRSIGSPDMIERVHIRDTVVQFVIALAKEEYDLTDCTKHQIYRFIAYILINDKLFGPRLRHHTLAIYQCCCYSLNQYEQEHIQWELPYTIDHIRKMQSSINHEDSASDQESKLPQKSELPQKTPRHRSGKSDIIRYLLGGDDLFFDHNPRHEHELNDFLIECVEIETSNSTKEISELRDSLLTPRRSRKHDFPKQNIARAHSIPKHSQMPKSQAKLSRR